MFKLGFFVKQTDLERAFNEQTRAQTQVAWLIYQPYERGYEVVNVIMWFV